MPVHALTPRPAGKPREGETGSALYFAGSAEATLYRLWINALQKGKRVADADRLAGFGGGDAAVGCETIKVVEVLGARPRREMLAAQVTEALLKTEQVFSGVRIARRHAAARARVAALEVHLADAEAHRVGVLRTEELVFPERGHALYFQRGAKAAPCFAQAQAREPLTDGLEARRRDDRRPIGDGVIGKAAARMAHDDLLLQVDAEPLRGRLRVLRKRKLPRRDTAGVVGN